MTNEITPPPELVLQWLEDGPEDGDRISKHIATQAAMWGADLELDACCEWLSFYSAASDARDLRIARRPKTPTLKEQALEAFDFIGKCHAIAGPDWAAIRRALESLPG